MDIRVVAGLNARRYRMMLDISQEAVAVKIGADRAYVSHIERGVQNLTIIRLLELAEALGVRPAQLLDEDYAASAQTHPDQGS
jgi:transcriptional regulator with XRE-family HTH domain